MKTLVETSLFNLFASYTNGAGPALGELPAAYDDFVNCLATLSPAGDLTGQLRCLNYTKIELAFMRQAWLKIAAISCMTCLSTRRWRCWMRKRKY